MAREKGSLPVAAPADDKKRAIDSAMAQIEKMYGYGYVIERNFEDSEAYARQRRNRKGTNSKTADRGTRKSVSGTRISENSGLQRDASGDKMRINDNLSESGESNDDKNTKALGADGTGQNNDSIWERSNDSEKVYKNMGSRTETLGEGERTKLGHIPWSGRIQSYDLNSSREKELSYGILRKISAGRIKEKDSLGRTISQQVQKYFSNTVIKTEDGLLIPLYHATDNEFDVFEYGDFGFHIGSAEQAMYLDKKYIKEVYVNIKNPLFINNDPLHWPGLAISAHALSQDIITLEDFNALYKLEGFSSFAYNSEANKAIRKLLKEKGYDGIIYPNGVEGEGISAIAFDSEQIKYTSNQNPTTNKNLRKSVSGTRVVEGTTSSTASGPPSPQGEGSGGSSEKAKYTDRFSREKLRSRIDSDFTYLHGMLKVPTDKRHIPEHLRAEVAAVLDCIKFETKQLDKIRDAGKEAQSPTAIKLAGISGLYEDIIRKAWGVEKSGESKTKGRFYCHTKNKLMIIHQLVFVCIKLCCLFNCIITFNHNKAGS